MSHLKTVTAAVLAASLLVPGAASALPAGPRPATADLAAGVAPEKTAKVIVKGGGHHHGVVVVGRPGGFYGKPYHGGIVVKPHKVVVRPWHHRPHYGYWVGGVALGTVLAVGAVGMVPAAPGPDLCWYWTDGRRIQGYWDYCQ
ncbi:hypothetical protein [Prosthecodimorpha staleyi]|uniref:Uncharacterized protein n=1 Tax=Prosthecodimorpha staleyi TaxID=2840188 RepID=A0A947D5I2_9HYPH|nr:hypothetical protein [Prosthecodimorpha staleyi]MBT9290559.1 hypothetical protein [Prosthecodimorpha staleyi]